MIIYHAGHGHSIESTPFINHMIQNGGAKFLLSYIVFDINRYLWIIKKQLLNDLPKIK